MAWYRAGGGGIPSSLKTGMNDVLNKKFGTSTTYDPAGWPDDVNLLGKLPEKTASGAIANITDGADGVPLKELIFSASPVQAAGTPSPSNPLPISGHTSLTGVHCGKNLLDLSNITNGDWSGTGAEYVNNVVVVLPMPIKGGANYIMTCSSSVSGFYVRFYDENDTLITEGTISVYNATSKTFSAPANAVKYKTMWYNAGGLTPADVISKNYMIEVGSTATTYVAYQTPESKKWEFPPFGKNLLNYDTLVDGYVNIDGTFNTAHTQGEMRSQFIPVEPNTTYYFSIQATGSSYNAWVRIGQYSDANTSAFIKTNSYWSFTTDENAKYIVVSARNLAEATQVQLEKSSTQTSYEPYQYMFSGQVNALTGETESKAKTVDLGTLTWNVDSNRTGVFYANAISDAVTDNCAMLCSAYKVDNAKNPNTIADYELCSRSSYGGKRVFIKNTNYSGYTGAQVATALSGTILLYELATPISIDMDSVDWQTQLGDNNFYNDCGDTEVTYRMDIDLALGGN